MKQACKYHPAARARWYCPRDGIHFCDECVAGDEIGARQVRSLLSNRVLEPVPTPIGTTPFVRILPHFLRHPLTPIAAALALLPVLALLATGLAPLAAAVFVLTGLPLAGWGGRVMYHGREGHMDPPPAEWPGEGGWLTGLVLWVPWTMLVVLAVAGVYYVGLAAGLAVVVLSALLFPMLFLAFLRSPNPARALQRIHAPPLVLGVEYLVLAGVLAIAGALVLCIGWVLHDLLPERVAAGLAVLPVAWLWLFTARLAGYLGCQYQNELEIETRERELLRRRARNRKPEDQRRVPVLLREGRYDKVRELLETWLEKKPEDLALNEQYARLLEAMDERQGQLEQADRYLGALLRAEQNHRVPELVRHYRELDPGFRPRAPELRWQVARELAGVGEAKEAVRMLQGLHEQHPEWQGVGEAYVFMARLLAFDLKMPAKAEQFLKFVDRNYPKPKTRQQVNELRGELTSTADAQEDSGKRS